MNCAKECFYSCELETYQRGSKRENTSQFPTRQSEPRYSCNCNTQDFNKTPLPVNVLVSSNQGNLSIPQLMPVKTFENFVLVSITLQGPVLKFRMVTGHSIPPLPCRLVLVMEKPCISLRKVKCNNLASRIVEKNNARESGSFLRKLLKLLVLPSASEKGDQLTMDSWCDIL